MKQKMLESLNKIKNTLENHSKIVLIILFMAGVLIYRFLISKVTSITFLGVDEELYISMARTFFYEGVFAKGYEILNYNCIIYSMLISISYFFYTANNILFIMRSIGVILMVSGIFPIYLLSKKVLGSKMKAIGIAIIFLILPEMGLSSYVIQEVLLYPVFLWTVYLVYLKFIREKNKILDIGIILLFAIMFFIKSYTIAFGAAYFLSLLICNRKKDIKGIILQGTIFAIIIFLGYVVIYTINDFQMGTNHYTEQITRIFPITINTFVNFAYGIWYYAVFFLFCTGILPIIIPILNLNKYEEKDRKFIIFLIISVIITIIETALIVFIPEESNKIYPHKFCYRYLSPIIIPFIIMLLKLKKIKITNIEIVVYIIEFLYLIWYYIGQGSITTAIDAPILFCIQYVYGRMLSVILIIIFAIISLVMLIQNIKKAEDIKKMYVIAIIVGSLIFTPIYWINIMKLSNESFRGTILKSDFEKIIKEFENDYDRIYLVDNKEIIYKHVRAISGQLKNDYRVIEIRRYNRHTRKKNMCNNSKRI